MGNTRKLSIVAAVIGAGLLVGCMPKLLGQFIESANAESLDTGCLDALSYIPPFVNFNGWAP